MAEAVALSVVDKVLEALITPIGRQLGYLFFYNGNVKNMISQTEKLEAKKSAVELLVEAGKNNAEVVGPDVKLWLKSVDERKEEENLILAGIEKVGKGCFNQWCLHLKSRYQLGRKASKFTQDLHLLLVEGNFVRVSNPPPSLAKVPSLKPGDAPDLDLSADSSKGFHSRFILARDVIKDLKDDKVWMIGVSGMGGVGKTTLVDEVTTWAKREHIFDEIVKVVVSKDADLKKIQRDIAELLQFEFREESLHARADRLRERLAQEGDNGQHKKVLVVLDDLWKRLDLKEVGIPCGEYRRGCKILLTSRNKNVFLEMRVDRIFIVQLLSWDESWSLFKDSLGDDARLYPIATSIVEECAGLPLATATIAIALIGKEESTWKYVHKQLKKSVLEEEYSIVYTTLQLSYEFIKNEEIKSLFLLCCLFPEDAQIPIEELVRYTVGLSMLKKQHKLHEEREKVFFYIEKLKNSNLLLNNEQENHVRMHDLVRDFGISISERFMIRFYDDMIKTWPIEEIDEDLTSISLQCSEITDELPSGLKYQNLKLLRFTSLSNNHSLKFSESFFDGMSQLQVLYCTNMSIPKFPGSIDLLLNLRSLSLARCRIQFDISLLSKLKNLEILSFAYSDVIALPKEIGYLSRLKLLDLTGCRNLGRIAPGVLSSLVCLEELYLGYGGSFSLSDCLNHNDVDFEYRERNLSMDELNKLPNLVVFDGSLSTEILATSLPFLRLLKNFRITTRQFQIYEITIDYNFCNTLHFENKSVEASEVESIVKGMCVRTEDLRLAHVDVKFLVNGFGGYTQLRSLKLDRCSSMSYILGSPDNPNVFPNLQSLKIYDVNDLEGLFSGQSLKKSQSPSLHYLPPFSNLRELDIGRCYGMKSLCSVSVARGLKELRSLEISYCSSMVEVFSKDKEDTDKINNAPSKLIFPRLHYLSLQGLKKLIGFSKSSEEIEFPLLETVSLYDLPMITSIYSDKGALPSHSKDAASQNHSLFIKEVTLPSLVNLNLTKMNNMKTIFDLQAPEAYPELKSLKVKDLPNLEHVWSNGSPDFVHRAALNLSSIKIKRCNRLLQLFNMGETGDNSDEDVKELDENFSAIAQDVDIKGQVEEEIKDEEEKILLPGLTYLDLRWVPNLSSLTPKNYTLNWSSIEEVGDLIPAGHKYWDFLWNLGPGFIYES